MRSLLVVVLTGVVAAASLTAQSAQPITQSLRTSWDAAKKNIVESAEVMPEANYRDAALAAADDRRLSEIIEMPFGMGKAARASAFVMNIGHLNEHYGNLVTYFRIKGIVPPSSR